MPSLSKEQIAEARQVNLLEYMLHYKPETLFRRGSEYRSKIHSSLVISLDGSKWHWFAGGIGGRSALDYLVHVEKLPFQAAVELLSSPSTAPTPQRVPDITVSTQSKEFALPAQCRYSDRAMTYLTGRGIDRDIIQHCIRQGTIYESYPHHNVVFVGKDQSGAPRFASLRGTMAGSSFRMDQPGSDKRYSFRFVPPGCDPLYQRWVAVFEAPIDALSYVTLNRLYRLNPINWDKLPCLALSGTAPAALMQYLKDHPNVDTIYLGLDNDTAGQKGVSLITQAIRHDPVFTKQVKHIIPMLPTAEQGKDYNEALLQISSKTPQKKLVPSSVHRI